MTPDDRKHAIVTAAIELFSEAGFDGSTRDVARSAGITQPLLYRYFPNKDSLVEAVYTRVFLQSWKPEWDLLLEDRNHRVRVRFQRFYEAYTETVFDPVWMRLWNFAVLRDARIYDWYNTVVEEQILKPLVRERRMELGANTDFTVSRGELEVPRLVHDGLMQHGLHRHVQGLDVLSGREVVIAQALDMYLLLTRVQDQPDTRPNCKI